MEHICSLQKSVYDRAKRNKNKNDVKFLSMIMEDEQENTEKKYENFKKIMRISSIENEEKGLNEQKGGDDERETIQRSQTVKFYNQFVINNLEISEIIGPGKDP